MIDKWTYLNKFLLLLRRWVAERVADRNNNKIIEKIDFYLNFVQKFEYFKPRIIERYK